MNKHSVLVIAVCAIMLSVGCGMMPGSNEPANRTATPEGLAGTWELNARLDLVFNADGNWHELLSSGTRNESVTYRILSMTMMELCYTGIACTNVAYQFNGRRLIIGAHRFSRRSGFSEIAHSVSERTYTKRN